MSIYHRIICWLCVAVVAVADIPCISAETFAGKMEVISFQNIDVKTVNYSSGIGYNGALKEIVVSDGRNKTIIHNKSLYYTTYCDSEMKKLCVWSEKLGEGIEVNYDEYIALYSGMSDIPRQFMGITLPASTYDIHKKSNIEAFGFSAEVYSGRTESISTGVDVQYEVIPSIQSTPFLRSYLQSGLNVSGLVVKFRWTADVRAYILGQLKSYKGMKVVSLDTSYQPCDADFECPPNVIVKQTKIQNTARFYKRLAKYLKKNNLFPDQTGNEFIYEVNEDEWSY